MAKTVVSVVGYSELKAEGYPTAIRVGSPAWFEWLVNHRSFRYECSRGHFTACKESRKGGNFWYANRRVDGKLRRSYLGASNDLTLEKLEEVAVKLSGSDRTYEQRKSYTTDKQFDSCVTSKEQELLKQLSELTEQLKEAKYRVSSLENENARLTKLGQDYSRETVSKLSEKYIHSLREVQEWKDTADSYKRQAMKLRDELTQVQEPQVSDIDLSKTKVYQLHKRPVVRLEDLESAGYRVIHPACHPQVALPQAVSAIAL